MYNTTGGITPVNLDGPKRTSPLKQLAKTYFNPTPSGNDTNEVKKGGAGSNAPAIFGNGYGFAASRLSSATGATNL